MKLIRTAMLVMGAVFALGSQTAMAETKEQVIIIKDHKFEPTEVKIPADERVKLIIKNEDETAEEFESHDLKREKIVKGGGQISVYVGPLKPGKYEFFGEFNPDTARGWVVVE